MLLPLDMLRRRRVGRGRRGQRRAGLGRPAGRTRHPPGLPPPGAAARLARACSHVGRLQALPARRRVLADPRPPVVAGRLMPTLDQLRPGRRAEVDAARRRPGPRAAALRDRACSKARTVEVARLRPARRPDRDPPRQHPPEPPQAEAAGVTVRPLLNATRRPSMPATTAHRRPGRQPEHRQDRPCSTPCPGCGSASATTPASPSR